MDKARGGVAQPRRAMACNAPWHPWYCWHRWQRRIRKLLIGKGPSGFESAPLGLWPLLCFQYVSWRGGFAACNAPAIRPQDWASEEAEKTADRATRHRQRRPAGLSSSNADAAADWWLWHRPGRSKQPFTGRPPTRIKLSARTGGHRLPAAEPPGGRAVARSVPNSGSTRFHHDRRGWRRGEKACELATIQPPPRDDASLRIGDREFEDGLRDIDGHGASGDTVSSW